MPQFFEYLNGPMDGQSVYTEAKDVHWSFDGGHYRPVDGFEILAGHVADEDDIIFMMWEPDEGTPTARTITTADEVSSLGPGSVVHEPNGTRWRLMFSHLIGSHWLSDKYEQSEIPPLPVTVVWEEPAV